MAVGRDSGRIHDRLGRANLGGAAMTGLVEAVATRDTHSAALFARLEASGQHTTGFTVWVAKSTASLATDVANRLHGLGIAVRLWDDSVAPIPVSHAQSVAAAASAAQPARQTLNPSVTPIWRGGLAPGAMRRVRDHIECALSERLELSELARIAGLSECHFSRAFRQSFGVPPHRYVVARRVEVAAGLVERTNRSLTDIALAVGFADHSHFTRTFARMTGETPGAYRRRHR